LKLHLEPQKLLNEHYEEAQINKRPIKESTAIGANVHERFPAQSAMLERTTENGVSGKKTGTHATGIAAKEWVAEEEYLSALFDEVVTLQERPNVVNGM
jgi:hypothetical protein